MRCDNNPSVLFGVYAPPEEINKFLNAVKLKGLGIRELRLFDIAIPLDDDYDDTINFFKHFIRCDYWYDRNPLNRSHGMMVDKMLKTAFEKTCYQPVRYKKDSWNPDKRHFLLSSLCVPLLFQNVGLDVCTTPKERTNLIKLENFESEGYESAEDKEYREIREKIEEQGENVPD